MIKYFLTISLIWMAVYFANAQRISTSNFPKEVTEALNLAGNNRTEPEKLISRYSVKKEDSLKLKAAYFLISNMRWHYTPHKNIQPDSLFLQIFSLADSMYYHLVKGKNSTEIKARPVNDSIGKIATFINNIMVNSHFSEPKTNMAGEGQTDLHTKSADFLSEQIEHAFFIRKKSPWVAKLSFDEFCTYTLPYKLLDGIPFRKTGKDFYTFFSKYIGDISTGDMTEYVARYNLTVNNLRKILGKYPFEERTGFEELFFMGVKGFDCFPITEYCAAALNACGIPVDIEYNTAYQMLQGMHSMCRIHASLGLWSRFSPEFQTPQKISTPADFYIHPSSTDKVMNMNNTMNLLKVHFAAQKQSPYFLKNNNEYTPYNLSDPCMQDVSAQKMITVQLTLPFKERTDNHLCYLATFNSATGIIPVNWTIIDKKRQQAIFKNTIPDRLYFPIYYEAGEPQSFGEPFLLQYDSTVKEQYRMVYLHQSSSQSTDIVVTRKFPQKPNMIQVANEMKGTVFLASDDASFKNADTLYLLDYAPPPYLQDIIIKKTKPYQYYRIKGPASFPKVNISELQLLTAKKYSYDNVVTPTPTAVLKPKDINTEKDTLEWMLQESFEKVRTYKISDGSMETSPGSAWGNTFVDIKYPTPRIITTIRFAPLNANNGINPGNDYLLRYWHNGQWNDFEFPQTAEYNYIEYKNVPKNKLYWLKNLSGGKEELPFVVDEKGKQQFIYFDVK